MTPRLSRRAFVRHSGVGLLSFCVAGCRLEMSPAEAHRRGIPFQVLSEDEVTTLEAYGETLLPGSAKAGLAHFIDHQLGAPAVDQMLIIKYLGVDPPFASFYSSGLGNLDAAAKARHKSPFALLSADQRIALTGQLAQANPDGWDGPPAPFLYFVLRNDALDVVYGTQAGVESLGLPYMAHIEPPSRWGD